VEDLKRNLLSCVAWLESAPAPSSFETKDALMTFLVEEIMSRTLYMLRVGVSLAPSETVVERGYSKHQAVIVGHLVRLTKLYDAFSLHVARNEFEIAGIFNRLIFETELRISYFLASKNKRRALRSYIFTSFRAERESLIDLTEKRKRGPLIPIERRMIRSMMRDLREDGITFKELRKNKAWNVDGKDTRAMLKALGREWEYAYGFGGSSRWIHGGWLELKRFHLKKKQGFYEPQLDYGVPDPRVAAPTTILVLEVLLKFLKWNRSDPDSLVSPIIEGLKELSLKVDLDHERRLQENAS
jgi:hypothetical protein